MPACTLCGAPDAPHPHVADLEGAIARAAPADWSHTVVGGTTRDVSVRLPPDAVTWVCARCAPAYAAAHPTFQPRPGPG